MPPSEFRFRVDDVPVLKLHHEPRPGPAVVVLHGLGGSKEVQRKELVSLADHGLAAVGLDAPHHGARRDGWLDAMAELAPPHSHEKFLHLVVAAVPEVRRVVDHVVAEGHFPVGILGISMGAYIALAAAADDQRLRATVSILGSPDWTPRRGPVTDGIAALMRLAPRHRPEALARHPVLFLNAGRDVNVPPRFARDFVNQVKATQPDLGARLDYVEYPESDHFMRASDWHDLWQRAVRFLRRELVGR